MGVSFGETHRTRASYAKSFSLSKRTIGWKTTERSQGLTSPSKKRASFSANLPLALGASESRLERGGSVDGSARAISVGETPDERLDGGGSVIGSVMERGTAMFALDCRADAKLQIQA
jgi:hypothetical protein